MRNTVDILGIPVDNVTMGQAVERFDQFLEGQGLHMIFTPNAEIMMTAQRDPELKAILCRADLLAADGAGVVLAAKILGSNLPERVAGYDLMRNMLGHASKRPFKAFLFGAAPGVASIAAENILNNYSGVEIAGIENGYNNKAYEDKLIGNINSSGADVLFVALGVPRQEKWIFENRFRLQVKVCMGVGGSLDVLSGKTKRAPGFFCKYGLEWLYRLYKDPRRFKRMLDLPRFVLLAVRERIC